MGNPTLRARIALAYEPAMSEREKSAHHVGGQGQMAYSNLITFITRTDLTGEGIVAECC